jgi:putative redox protein
MIEPLDEAEKKPPLTVFKPPSKIHLKWIGGLRFDTGRVDGPRVLIDGQSRAAPGPVETLVGALAACSAVDVLSILNKRRTPPDSMEVNIVAQRAQAIPARITSVRIAYRIKGADIDRAGCERAIDLSINKYCSVRDSLDKDIPVEWSLELNEESSADATEVTGKP